jgi:hypothetical protein
MQSSQQENVQQRRQNAFVSKEEATMTLEIFSHGQIALDFYGTHQK